MLLQFPEIPYTIHWIDSDSALQSLCNRLNGATILAIDTEFDRFRRKYGINLELIQLFDGNAVYLIRVGSLLNILPLKGIMENETVVKLLYSGSEDIQVFKVNGIAPKGVYDLQSASQLSGFSAMSLAGILQEVLGVSFDKSKQTSDWSKAELDREQIIYASNDVIYLIDLYERFKLNANKLKTELFIQEENRLLEAVDVSESKPRLKQPQREKYNRHEQAMLLGLMYVRDGLGQLVNKPPHFVLSDVQLEDILQHRLNYLGESQLKGYSAFFRRGRDFLLKADREIRNVLSMDWPPPRTVVSRDDLPRLQKVVLANEKVDDLITTYTLYLSDIYCTSVATYLCSGIKRYMRDKLAGATQFNFPPYRIKLFNQFLTERKLSLHDILASGI